jgi:metal-sulfur cluster biosynthetic enzyme
MPTVDQVKEALREVYDPEIGFNIVELGLVYDVQVDEENNVHIKMTLTTPFCPLGPLIEQQVDAVLRALYPETKQIDIELVWSPPWDPRTMASEEVKTALGIW